jgi:hypothetical protein
VSAGGVVGTNTKITARAIGDGSSINLGSTVSKLTIDHAGDATITAAAITKLKSTGDFGADVTAGSLGKATVGGQLTNATWRIAGNVKSITLGSAVGSTIFAGVADSTTTLPTDASEFVAVAKIKKLTVKNTFSNTNIAAAALGKVKINGVNPDNGAVAFGLATRSVDSVKVTDGATTVLKWKDGDDLALLDLPGDGTVRVI